MGSISGVISSLSSLAAKLLPGSGRSSSSSSSSDESPIIKEELDKLTRTLERVKATLYDAEEREVKERSVKLWLKELKEVAYSMENVLDDYNYEVLQAEVEARNASSENSLKRKKLELPDGMTDRIKKTMSKFDEIANHRISLQLREEDGPRCWNNEQQITPTSHMVIESNIFGRESEKDELIDLLCPNSIDDDDDVISVVAIVGIGGLGKTTLAQLVYNDARIREKFDLFGWVCVSEDFSVQRLTKEAFESITKAVQSFQNLGVLQEGLSEKIKGKRVLLVLDDVWNEKRGNWELFRTPFLSAKFAKILVTTRNEPVARTMQSASLFKLGYLSEEQCWQLFQQYAIGRVTNIERWKLEIGKEIMERCGRLPLAVKSVASLLRHETSEESWKDILQSELWELDLTKEIFGPLQISYSRLPSYLKPCLLYCSMFPKDYEYEVGELVQLWFAQGYIESRRGKNIKEIGQEYAKQLAERSFFDDIWTDSGLLRKVKLHDMIHDLARSNSGNECFSIECGKHANCPTQIYHLCVDNIFHLVKPFPVSSFGALRTLVVRPQVENFAIISVLSETQALRAIKLEFRSCGFELLNSIGNMKHLRYISLAYVTSEKLPESICSLYNLQTLELHGCNLTELPNNIGNLVSLQFLDFSGSLVIQKFPDSICGLKNLKALRVYASNNMVELPEHIGNLAKLEELVLRNCGITILPASLCQLKYLKKLLLRYCSYLKELPREIGKLTNLQKLVVFGCGRISNLPPSFNKLVRIQQLEIHLYVTMDNSHDALSWLNDIVDLKGTLCFSGLKKMKSLASVKHISLMNKGELKGLILLWDELYRLYEDVVVYLEIENGGNDGFLSDEMDLFLVESLQPHPNIEELRIDGYRGITFPEWIGDPISCCSLTTIFLENCVNLAFLPFCNLHNLKHLEITSCHGLHFLKAEFVPSQLQYLYLYSCEGLISMPGIQKLKCLVELKIDRCPNLQSLLMVPSLELTMHSNDSLDDDLSIELTMHSNDSLDDDLSIGLRNLIALQSLKIGHCPKLWLLADELLPVESCKVEIIDCPRLRDWCLQHNFEYGDFFLYEGVMRSLAMRLRSTLE